MLYPRKYCYLFFSKYGAEGIWAVAAKYHLHMKASEICRGFYMEAAEIGKG